MTLDVGSYGRDGLDVPHRQAERFFADLLQVFVFDITVLDDDIAQAHRVDDAQTLAFRAGADREHCDYCTDAEDHSQHRQEGAKFVHPEIADGKLYFGHVSHIWDSAFSIQHSAFSIQGPGFRFHGTAYLQPNN